MDQAKVRRMYEARDERLKLQRQVDTLEQEEKDIAYEITSYMREIGEDQLISFGFVVDLKSKLAPFVTSWPETLKFVKETGALDLLQKRLTESAVKARWDAGVDIPGVDKIDKYTVTITKE